MSLSRADTPTDPPHHQDADRAHGSEDKPSDALLFSFLASRDASCPVCSYNLRGLTTGSCPECAAELHLEVGSNNLRPGPWFLSVVSCSLGLGFDAVVCLLMGGGLILFPPRGQANVLNLLAVLTGFAVLAGACGLGLWLLFSRRSRWNRLSRAAQKRWAAGLFAAVFVLHASYGGFLLWVM